LPSPTEKAGYIHRVVTLLPPQMKWVQNTPEN
jgi:hypothetical protein